MVKQVTSGPFTLPLILGGTVTHKEGIAPNQARVDFKIDDLIRIDDLPKSKTDLLNIDDKVKFTLTPGTGSSNNLEKL